ncbi:MAG TPA: LLM class flavin-dependent oxidoreductase [Acidimicrobiia bacterium]|nr:LLM class flavin-dependent oxidoreductase [Acidimicrobiia bacterium]
MAFLTMRHDFRAPASASVPASVSAAEIYATAIEQFRWADAHGFDFAVVSEHHGIDDGWLPAPLTLAATVIGATPRIPVLVSALLAPLHDPVRLAEQIAVIDLASGGGRLWVVLGAGYRAAEFEMADVDMRRRGKLVEEYARVMLDAWTGEPFEWRGRTITVTPKPVTEPHPTLMIGGGTEPAARRAARLRLPMMPMNADPQLAQWYADEAAKTGFTEGFVMTPGGPTFIYVTEDPERAWSQLGPYLLYEAQTYESFQTPGQTSTPMVAADTVADLQASPQYLVGTPDEVVARWDSLDPASALTFHPLAGGLPPDLSWPSLELFASAVLGRIRTAQ